MADDTIHKEHRKRMMQRFREHGLATMNDHEAIEVLLYYVIPRKDTNALAHRLKREFGTLHGVLEASEEELMRIEGVGESCAGYLHFLQEFFERYHTDRVREKQQAVPLDSFQRLREYFVPQLDGQPVEQVLAAYLNSRHQVIRCEKLGSGLSERVGLDVRRLLDSVRDCNAAAVALAHNHPNGQLMASPEDIELTARVRDMLELIGVRLVDHLVVANGTCCSANFRFGERRRG